MTKLAEVSDIPEGKSIVVRDAAGREIALYNVKGEIYGLENVCPHMGGPLGEGDIENCLVTCPWHGWLFDIKTGACENMPGEDAAKISLVIKNGSVFLDESSGKGGCANDKCKGCG